MRWLWLCVWLTLAGQSALAQATLTDDPRLQPRITLWLKMEPLRDVLRAASRQTGIPLRCQQASPCAAKTPFSTTRSPSS
jgi:hypothetical protein